MSNWDIKILQDSIKKIITILIPKKKKIKIGIILKIKRDRFTI